MIQIALYGKGGIGKSTIASNVSAALAEQGYRVMQIGCDPKADSTTNLLGGRQLTTVSQLLREKGPALGLDEMVAEGCRGILCVEAGGPTPGVGCAGRAISAVLEALKEKGAFEKYRPDVVIYDVLGDVVCGGFSVPMRRGYADHLFIVTSGENMALHAAANIGAAVAQFQSRGYARLGGIILNRRNVKQEDEKTRELAEDIHTEIIGVVNRSETIPDAEDLHQTVLEAFPDSASAEELRNIARQILRACGETSC